MPKSYPIEECYLATVVVVERTVVVVVVGGTVVVVVGVGMGLAFGVLDTVLDDGDCPLALVAITLKV